MMPIKNIWVTCGLFLFTACTDSANTTEETVADTITAVVTDTTHRSPEIINKSNGSISIEQHIQTALPGWKVPEKNSWEKYWYERYKEGKNLIYRVQSDFDGNGQTDYAYILKDSANKHTVWAFLKNDTSFTAHRIYDITQLNNSKLHVGLAVLKAGSFDDLNTAGGEPVKVKTDHPAIHVIFFETAAKAYYWKDSTFHLIQTGD
jgi:phenylpyruvate tautomerase PptA (4-oxalocrotonate tautomerase family)